MGRKSTYNDLMLRELTKNAPPTSLDSTSPDTLHERRGRLSLHALRLIRRLLNMADADFTQVPIPDWELLDSVYSSNLKSMKKRYAS